MISPQEAAQITMLMRVSNLLQSRPEILEENESLKESYAELRDGVEEIMGMLTEAEKDELLERYRLEATPLTVRPVKEAN